MPALKLKETRDTLLVCLTEARILDDVTTQEIGKGLLGLADRAAKAGLKIIVDFRGVHFMSSAMIGRLISLHKAAKNGQVVLTFRNVSPSVMGVFRVTRLDKIFRFEADVQVSEEDPMLCPSQPPLGNRSEVGVNPWTLKACAPVSDNCQ